MVVSEAALTVGTVEELYRYPVKSMQGLRVQSVQLHLSGVAQDRERALIDTVSGRLMSAKRWSKLLLASADDDGIVLPAGNRLAFTDRDIDAVLSHWLGREVALRRVEVDTQVSYEMTFDPPNDEAEIYEIPTPPGSFLDLAALHLVSRQTLDGNGRTRPDLDWDVRRFRPNLVADMPGGNAFGEDSWCGMQFQIGSAVVEAIQPTVRCAMPLRAQPGLSAQPTLFSALDSIHANHLGIYLSVITPGEISVGDPIQSVC
jgi:uncharacterized protein